MTGPSVANLKRTPPEGLVNAIGYCGDTYSVKTVDGKVEKVWEFNLRFKTDSSARGPRKDEPVLVGQGCRVTARKSSFTIPSEMAAFIKPQCP